MAMAVATYSAADATTSLVFNDNGSGEVVIPWGNPWWEGGWWGDPGWWLELVVVMVMLGGAVEGDDGGCSFS